MNSFTRSYDVKYISNQELDAGEKLILMILLSMRNLPEIRISIDSLAEQSSLGTATVKRKLKSLQQKKFIRRISKGTKNCSVTVVNDLEVAMAVKRANPTIFYRMRSFTSGEEVSL